MPCGTVIFKLERMLCGTFFFARFNYNTICYKQNMPNFNTEGATLENVMQI